MPASGATARTAVTRSPSTNAPGSSRTSFATQMRARSGFTVRSTRAITRPRRDDDEGVRALADDGDGALGHDHDAQRVWIRAIEADGRDRRQRRDVDLGARRDRARRGSAPRGRAEPARPAARRPAPAPLTSIVRTANSDVSRASTRARSTAPNTAKPTSNERPEGTKAASSRRSPVAARGNGTTTLAGRVRGRAPRPGRPLLGHRPLFAAGRGFLAAPAADRQLEPPAARPRARARRRTARARAGVPPPSARGSRRSSPRRRSR